MHSGPRFLFCKNSGLGSEQLLPAGICLGATGNFLRQAEKDLVVAHFRRKQCPVKPREFGVPGLRRQEAEPFAGANFNQGGDQNPVERFFRSSQTDESAERFGVRIAVPTSQASTPATEDAHHLGKVSGLIASHARHGFNPPGHPFAGPAREQFNGVLGGFPFEESVIDQQGNRVCQSRPRPFRRCTRVYRQRFGFFYQRGRHPTRLAQGDPV